MLAVIRYSGEKRPILIDEIHKIKELLEEIHDNMYKGQVFSEKGLCIKILMIFQC